MKTIPRSKYNEKIEDVDNLFEKEAEIRVYRIIQKSLNNILKHSDATETHAPIAKTERFVKIESPTTAKASTFKRRAKQTGAAIPGFWE